MTYHQWQMLAADQWWSFSGISGSAETATRDSPATASLNNMHQPVVTNVHERCVSTLAVVQDATTQCQQDMFGCSQTSDLADDWYSEKRRQNGRLGLSRVARHIRRSTEDLCKSTHLYKVWDQRHMTRHWRHAAWAFLRDHRVVCAIWLDEVLAFHGAPIELGDYCLVVHNVQVAAGILSQYGYQSIGWAEDDSILSQLQCQRIKLSAPGANADVVLLSATEWCYDLSHDALHDELCPYLPEYIDAMMELWLRVPTRSYRANVDLMHFLESIIYECYRLNDFGDDVCQDDYAVWLMPQHRELHFDIVARCTGLTKSNLNSQFRHRYHVHKANLIRQGSFKPVPRRKKAFNPQLPILAETPEDTRPTLKRTQGSFFISGNSVRILPDYTNIGIAL